jgi:hypothetical protein
MIFAIRKYACYLLPSVAIVLATIASFTTTASAADGTGSAATTIQTDPWKSPSDWFIYIVVILVFLASITALLLVKQALAGTNWSLSDALSEETDITATNPQNGAPVLDSGGKPVKITELRASSSRLIALMGMISIVIMYLGFGIFTLFGFAKTGEVPSSIDTIIKFLVSGLTLFAPYVINKFSSIFQSLSGGK